MTTVQISMTPCDTEQSCVITFFQKRWPRGFRCPFCGSAQPDQPPALIVVCRLCRRQTSITTHTVMHGSKKSLIAWMRVALLFCGHGDGLSARRLQHLFELSCYQTAWIWLQKVRRAAGLAENDPCRGNVLFTLTTLDLDTFATPFPPIIALACSLNNPKYNSSRIRLLALVNRGPADILLALELLAQKHATLLWTLPSGSWPAVAEQDYSWGSPTRLQRILAEDLLNNLSTWLSRVYRGGIESCYLQNYLDEYTFRHNTATWTNRQAVLDHLLCGLVAPWPSPSRPLLNRSTPREEEP